MFVTHAHNIRFAIYWVHCCESFPVNVNVVSIDNIELEANRCPNLAKFSSCSKCIFLYSPHVSLPVDLIASGL